MNLLTLLLPSLLLSSSPPTPSPTTNGTGATCHAPTPNDHVYFKDPANPNLILFIDPWRERNTIESIEPALEKAGFIITGHAYFNPNITARVSWMGREDAIAAQNEIQRTAMDEQCGWTRSGMSRISKTGRWGLWGIAWIMGPGWA